MPFAEGVTAGIDGALRVAADLRGEKVAQLIQLGMAYAPEPPFQSGTPESAPPDVLAESKNVGQALATRRLETARRLAARLGINVL
jgi:cyclohexyl-isocyanide hydratase